MSTTPKRLFAYFLSIIGLDRIAYSTATRTTTTSSSSSSSLSPSTFTHDSYSSTSTKTNVSFMSDSTLFVNADTAGVFDEKFVQDAGINMLSYDTWSLQTWLGGLSKMALCQIITTTAMKCPRVVLEMIEEYQPSVHHLKSRKQQHKTHLFHEEQVTEQDKNDFYHRREILAIRERAHIIIHSLDHLRPSEQFANEADLAEEIHCVVRWCTNTLHASPRGHSLAALMGLLVIAREGLAAVPEIRKYLFGEAHLGRIVILEMSGVLKNFKKPTTIHQHAAAEYLLPNQWSLLLSILDPPKEILQSASPHHQVTWLIQSLGDVCAQMADCDKGWTYRQEYDNVVNIAARNYCHPSP